MYTKGKLTDRDIDKGTELSSTLPFLILGLFPLKL